MAQNRSRKQVHESRALGLASTPKAARYFEKRPYDPGEYGRSHHRQESDCAVRLKEKQRLRIRHGIRESRLCRAFEEARHTAGLIDENLVELLEIRLDVLVLRAGFACMVRQARQSAVHRHILADGKIVNRPFFRAKPGQTIQVKPKSQTTVSFEIAAQGIHHDVLPAVPDYLDAELEHLRATLVCRPRRAEAPVTCDVQMVVEYYSR